ncbi:MAG: TIGR02611 family protein [Leucobacter sp.]
MSDMTVDELERAHRLGRPIGRFMERWRHAIHRRPWLNVVYRALITVLGASIVLVGLVLVPLPGPGWLIVFIGLTILGSEYHWARRLTSWLRMKLAQFWEWWKARRAARRA